MYTHIYICVRRQQTPFDNGTPLINRAGGEK